VLCVGLGRYGHVLDGLPGVNNHSGAYCTYRTITTIAGWFRGGGGGGPGAENKPLGLFCFNE
jgi:hypothetical protein